MATEQRAHPRQSQRYVVRLHLDEPGGDPKTVRGILLDLSLGGAKAEIEEFLQAGQQCLFELMGASGRVVPNKVPGTVMEAVPGPGRQMTVRIAFEKPLKVIKQPGKI